MPCAGPDLDYARKLSVDCYKEILELLDKRGIKPFRDCKGMPPIFMRLHAKLNNMLDVELKEFLEKLFVEDACASF